MVELFGVKGLWVALTLLTTVLYLIVGGALLTIWLKILETHNFCIFDDGEPVPPWWAVWPVMCFFVFIIGPPSTLLVFILAGSLFVYALIRVTLWILLSPVVLGSTAIEYTNGPSVTLGLVWVMTLLGTALVFYALITEF